MHAPPSLSELQAGFARAMVDGAAPALLPWMVGRFTHLQPEELARYSANIKADIAWCDARHLEYVPCLYPGFSWHNLSKIETGRAGPLDQIPRQNGKFLWSQASTAMAAGAKMFYVAMFDEMDEGTAIFKCAGQPPGGASFVACSSLPSDYYLWLTGEAGKMLRGEIPFSRQIPVRVAAEKQP